jgi:hypothetical protein
MLSQTEPRARSPAVRPSSSASQRRALAQTQPARAGSRRLAGAGSQALAQTELAGSRTLPQSNFEPAKGDTLVCSLPASHSRSGSCSHTGRCDHGQPPSVPPMC